MQKNQITVGVENGLLPLEHDERDLTLAGVFGQINIEEVPGKDFVVSEPLVIKDQGETDYCSAYAVTGVSEDQEGIELLPEYQFFKTKQLSRDAESWGANLRDACRVPVKFGSLPLIGNERFSGIPRSEIVNPATWPISLDTEARNYAKETFLKIDGKYDLFDNIRTALWQHRSEHRSIVVGAQFKDAWINAVGGIIPIDSYAGGYGHAFKLYGQKIINGAPYLVAQLSNGTSIGDGGKFYFPREVVNRDLAPYGQFMFKDISRDEAEYYMNAPFNKNTPFIKRLLLVVINLFK